MEAVNRMEFWVEILPAIVVAIPSIIVGWVAMEHRNVRMHKIGFWPMQWVTPKGRRIKRLMKEVGESYTWVHLQRGVGEHMWDILVPETGEHMWDILVPETVDNTAIKFDKVKDALAFLEDRGLLRVVRQESSDRRPRFGVANAKDGVEVTREVAWYEFTEHAMLYIRRAQGGMPDMLEDVRDILKDVRSSAFDPDIMGCGKTKVVMEVFLRPNSSTQSAERLEIKSSIELNYDLCKSMVKRAAMCYVMLPGTFRHVVIECYMVSKECEFHDVVQVIIDGKRASEIVQENIEVTEECATRLWKKMEIVVKGRSVHRRSCVQCGNDGSE